MSGSAVLDKYETVRTLGNGGDGETILVRHKVLGVLRAVKKLRRRSLIAIPLEANILKALSHPGIPIIYDFEQDDEFCYIIMEYIEGPSLAEYVAERTQVDMALMLFFGIQLCDILEYLHSRHPEPVLHLDLQPCNVLLSHSGNQLKLIDFGNALGLSGHGDFPTPKKGYGTHGFSAPELYHCETPGVTSDIFSLGKLLYYMLTGDVLYDISGSMTSHCFEKLSRMLQPSELGEQLGETICKCLYPTPALRYRDARTLKVSLEHLLHQLDSPLPGHVSSATIPNSGIHLAICGATPGIGSSHFSLALTNCLNKRRKPAIYIEEHAGQMLYRLKESDHMVREHHGIYSHGSCHMTFHSDYVESAATHAYSIKVHDYGVCDSETAMQIREQADQCLLVSGMMSWQTMICREALSILPEGTILLCNHGDQKMFQQLRRELGTSEHKRILRLPTIPNPFYTDSNSEHFFDTLLSLLQLD